MKLKILSPVHIGSGEEKSLSPYSDYVYQGDQVYYIDHNKLENWILSQSDPDRIMEEYIKGIKQRDALREFFIEHKLNVEDFSTHRIPILGNPRKEKINRTITNAGFPYIPGSTIKGAIRTAVLWKIQKHKKDRTTLMEYIWNNRKGPYIGEDIFGRFDKDVMKFLHVSDTGLFQREDLEIRNIQRISITNPSEEIPSWVEVINSDKEVSFDIKIKTREIDNPPSDLRGFLSPNTGVKSILKALNEFSKEIIEFELNALRKMYFVPIMEFYTKLNKEINNLSEKEAIMRIGFGKTFFDNTIDLLFKDDERIMDKIKEKTHKIPKYRILSKIFKFKPLFLIFHYLDNQDEIIKIQKYHYKIL